MRVEAKSASSQNQLTILLLLFVALAVGAYETGGFESSPPGGPLVAQPAFTGGSGPSGFAVGSADAGIITASRQA
jgi:hypothetical protein